MGGPCGGYVLDVAVMLSSDGCDMLLPMAFLDCMEPNSGTIAWETQSEA